MPTYEYQREDGSRFELVQKITEPALEVCPTTGLKVERLISAGHGGFILKGSGWYKTDYGSSGSGSKNGSGAKTASAEGAASSSSESSSSSDSGGSSSSSAGGSSSSSSSESSSAGSCGCGKAGGGCSSN